MFGKTKKLLNSTESNESAQYVSVTEFQDEIMYDNFLVKNGIVSFLKETNISGSNKNQREYFDKTANTYDFKVKIWSMLRDGSEFKHRMNYLNELQINDDHKVLEVSVGTGGNLKFLNKRANYYGLDISYKMLQQCLININKWKLNAKLILAEAENLPFKENSFDVVFHVGGINSFNNKKLAIEEMIRVAKPGIKITIVDETQKLADKFHTSILNKLFYKKDKEIIDEPLHYVPKNMLQTKLKYICDNDFYCLTFIKPLQTL